MPSSTLGTPRMGSRLGWMRVLSKMAARRHSNLHVGAEGNLSMMAGRRHASKRLGSVLMPLAVLSRRSLQHSGAGKCRLNVAVVLCQPEKGRGGTLALLQGRWSGGDRDSPVDSINVNEASGRGSRSPGMVSWKAGTLDALHKSCL